MVLHTDSAPATCGIFKKCVAVFWTFFWHKNTKNSTPPNKKLHFWYSLEKSCYEQGEQVSFFGPEAFFQGSHV